MDLLEAAALVNSMQKHDQIELNLRRFWINEKNVNKYVIDVVRNADNSDTYEIYKKILVWWFKIV